MMLTFPSINYASADQDICGEMITVPLMLLHDLQRCLLYTEVENDNIKFWRRMNLPCLRNHFLGSFEYLHFLLFFSI